MTDLKDKTRLAALSPLSGDRESYRFWKRVLRDAGKERCWSAIAPRLKQKISQWRPGSWHTQIPVDVNTIEIAKHQLLQWLSLPEPDCTKKLIAFEILDEKPGMFPFRRSIEFLLVRGLYEGMASSSDFAKPLMVFIDCLFESDRLDFRRELTDSDSITPDVG